MTRKRKSAECNDCGPAVELRKSIVRRPGSRALRESMEAEGQARAEADDKARLLAAYAAVGRAYVNYVSADTELDRNHHNATLAVYTRTALRIVNETKRKSGCT